MRGKASVQGKIKNILYLKRKPGVLNFRRRDVLTLKKLFKKNYGFSFSDKEIVPLLQEWMEYSQDREFPNTRKEEEMVFFFDQKYSHTLQIPDYLTFAPIDTETLSFSYKGDDADLFSKSYQFITKSDGPFSQSSYYDDELGSRLGKRSVLVVEFKKERELSEEEKIHFHRIKRMMSKSGVIKTH